MIGLTIRTLVIILLLAAAPTPAIRYAVMVCTTVTTICGIWLAYGEPPNLIMKANLHPYLDNAFFLRYCAPAAIATYLVVAWELRARLRGEVIDLEKMDVIDANAEDVRFLQAARHGEVLTPIELIEQHERELGTKTEALLERVREGEALGIAMVRENISETLRKKLLGHFVSEDLADTLDRHYVLNAGGDHALDNNVVADFASRALHRLDINILHLFAMAQIAGYALGGCWTHIGSAQSVVAFAFIQRDVDENYTPVEWIREITPVILKMLIVITLLIYLESILLDWLG